MDREQPHRDREIFQMRSTVRRSPHGQAKSGDGRNTRPGRRGSPRCGSRKRGRHGRSTMAPLSAPVSAPTSAPNRGRTCGRAALTTCRDTRNTWRRRALQARRPGGALGRPSGQREGPEQRGSDPPFHGGPCPSALRRCAGPSGRSPCPDDKPPPRRTRRTAASHDSSRPRHRSCAVGVRSPERSLTMSLIEPRTDRVRTVRHISACRNRIETRSCNMHGSSVTPSITC